MFKTMMNWFFPKKIKLRDLVMENPPPPPARKKVICYPNLPKGVPGRSFEIPWRLLPADMLAMVKPIPPKSITTKEYFKGIPNA